jgi:hypothetical protein
MYYKFILIFFIILSLALQDAIAEDSRYRVEILVLSHMQHGQDPDEVITLDDLSHALDFLTPPSESAVEEGMEGIDAAPEELSAALSEPQPVPDEAQEERPDQAGGESEDLDSEQDLLNAVVHIGEMGPEMQEAWRRLRLSAPFRPLQHLAWEQGSSEPFPLLRIHDLEPVLVEDPWSEERARREQEEAEESVVFGDVVQQDLPGLEAVVEEPLPDPIVYYRLDGTVSLTRSRFLHLSMAVELREPVFEDTMPPHAVNQPPTLPAAADEPLPEPRPSAFLVHRLEQSRPVRTGRMEYFDSPVLGILAWVTDISDTVVTESAD